jgi:hypothetical protein
VILKSEGALMERPFEGGPASRRQAIRISALAATACLAPVHRAGGASETDSPADPAAEPTPRPEDVGSVEANIGALYDAISGPAGPRNWDRLRSLFLPGARLIPAGRRPDGTIAARVLSVDDFIKAIEPRVKEEGFFESEIHRRVERFGAVAHVFSTYESRRARGDKPFVRGINSIQLFFDGKRWWVVTIFWDSERLDQPIPPEYLPGKAVGSRQ